jgi:hypothetical protein
MSQTVYLDAGGYNISYWAAQRGNYQSAPQTIEVLVDGVVIGTATPSSTNYNQYFTMNFAATAGPHTIQFLGLNNAGGDVTGFIDGILLAPAEDGTTQNSARTVLNNAVSDGGFEAPAQAVGAFAVAPNGSPWQFSGIAGVSYNNSGFTSGNPNSPEGVQVGFIKNGGSISQQVYLDAGMYSVAFLAAQRANFQSQAQQIEVLVDGNAVSTITPSSFYIPANGKYPAVTEPATYYTSYQSATFLVSGGMHTVQLLGLAPSSADSTAFVDAVAVNNANGVNDGNFETPQLATGNYAFNPTGTPWQFNGASGIATNASAFTIGNKNAPDGFQVAFLKQTANITQSVYLTAGLYSLSFMAAQRGTSQDSYQELEVLVDGNVVCDVVPSNTTTATSGVPQWGLYQTATFTVTAGLHTVKFLGVNPNGGDNTVLIDSVTF